jgi:hypothetical protein
MKRPRNFRGPNGARSRKFPGVGAVCSATFLSREAKSAVVRELSGRSMSAVCATSSRAKKSVTRSVPVWLGVAALVAVLSGARLASSRERSFALTWDAPAESPDPAPVSRGSTRTKTAGSTRSTRRRWLVRKPRSSFYTSANSDTSLVTQYEPVANTSQSSCQTLASRSWGPVSRRARRS